MIERIWITRTEPGASRLARSLKKAWFNPLVAPVMEVRPVEFSVPPLHTDVWVFVSMHAVSCVPLQYWDSTKPSIAVGPATAEELKRLLVVPWIPDQHNSEGVYALIRSALGNENRITIVAGRRGRKDLRKWLVADGYRCHEWAVYERKPTDFHIGDTHVDAIVISSRGALTGVRQQYQNEDSVSIPLVVPAPRYVELAHAEQFENVHVANGTSDTATVNALNVLFNR